MRITKYQQKVLEFMKDGFVIKYRQDKVSHAWWLFKDMGKGYIHSIDLLSSTVETLLLHKLIRYKKTDKYRHKIYVLTPQQEKK